MPHLICYDITNNSLRTKISNKLIEYGLDRINLSVYLGTINKSSLTALESFILEQIILKGEPNDSLLIIPIAAHQVNAIRIYGKNDLDKDEITGSKTTLIL